MNVTPAIAIAIAACPKSIDTAAEWATVVMATPATS